ncbi:MAG: hypothetical protein Q4G35_09355 [Propionibacteriaceae bacterium]|nr:hypothetical protein [Propionibacteriaceae bacterium]
MAQLAPWTLIAVDAPLERLRGLSVVVSARGRTAGDLVLALQITRAKSIAAMFSGAPRLGVAYATLGEAQAPRNTTVPTWLRVNDLVTEQLGGGTVENVLVVPGIRWGSRFNSSELTAVRQAQGSPEVFGTSQILARLSVGTVDGGPASTSAHARVAAVQQQLGALTTDIVFRIEHSALFDTSVPTTKHLNLMLMRWEDEHRQASPGALERLSHEVELAFRTAQDHAATVGLAHLPTTARPDARRAMKAAMLARSAATEGEREAALMQVTRLLDSLALYYLPAPAEAPRMIGSSGHGEAGS